MAIRRYTIDELLHLRNSPLVQKPEHLPAIEQWIEYVYLEVGGTREKLRIPHSESQQQQRSRPQPREAGTASPMGNFSAGQRPGLLGSRMTSKEDVSLGPPRTVFASSRTTTRLADFPDNTQGGEASEASDNRSGRQQALRKGDSDNKHFRESWTSARERRAATNEEDANLERGGKFSRRDRDREQDGDRRNGFGDRQETRWSLRDDKKPNGDRDRRWRSRERARQEREWDRGGHTDREPEWMEDAGAETGDELGGVSAMPKNQEDFEKWKQAQHARDKKPAAEEAISAAEPAAEPPVASESIAPPKPVAPLQLDSATSRPLFDWGKQPGGDLGSLANQSKSSSSKGKTSRFMPMFKKDEVREESAPPLTHVQKLSVDIANTSSEDKEGFQRILQMLGGSSIGPSSSATPAEPTSPMNRPSAGTRSKSRFTGFFDQGAKSPEVKDASNIPPQGPFSSQDIGQPLSANEHDSILTHSRRDGSFAGRGLMFDSEQPSSMPSHESRPQTAKTSDMHHDQPQRSSATPDVNIQNLLASQRTQRSQGPDKNSEFLLNLLQAKGGSRPPSQPPQPQGSFPLWLDQPPHPSEPLAPKPRIPPAPGLFESQLLRGAQNDGMANSDSQQRRMPQQRPPPGFYDEQTLLLQQQQQQQQQQRRNIPEPPQRMLQQIRRPNGPGQMPPMQLPFPPGGPIPPEFLQSAPPGYPQAPPPGFAAHAPRHPPGFHNMPNIFQQRESGVAGLNMGPPPNAPPGFFGGPLPQNLPQGGYMPMRSGAETTTNGVAAGNGRPDFGANDLGRGR